MKTLSFGLKLQLSQKTTVASVASALPAFHAFFRCDYLVAFSRCNWLRQDIPAQEAFAALGEGLADVHVKFGQEIESFLCKVYGKERLSSIDEVRFQVLASKYKPNKHADSGPAKEEEERRNSERV